MTEKRYIYIEKSDKMNDRKTDRKTRKVQLVINNPKEKGLSQENIRQLLNNWVAVSYYCMCDEIGHEGTYHTHIFIAFKDVTRFSTIKNKFPTAHIEFCRGTAKENRDYIRKEGKYENSKKKETNLPGTFFEFGEIPIERQGQRNDITDQYAMIKNGMSNYEILEQYEGDVDIDRVKKTRVEVENHKYKYEFRNVKVIYSYGDTGTGKTYSAYKESLEAEKEVYKVDEYKNPFDLYDGEEVIILDDWRDTEMSITSMLRLLDIYPLKLACRYAPKIARYQTVYITSNIPLEKCYFSNKHNIDTVTVNAFLRRITEYRVYTGRGEYNTKEIKFHEVKVDEPIPFK